MSSGGPLNSEFPKMVMCTKLNLERAGLEALPLRARIFLSFSQLQNARNPLQICTLTCSGKGLQKALILKLYPTIPRACSPASYRAHLPHRIQIPSMSASCPKQTPKRSSLMILLLNYLRPRICTTLSLLRAGPTYVECFFTPDPAAFFSASGLRPPVEDPEAKPPRRRARGRSESRICGLYGALPGPDLQPRLAAGQVVAAQRAAALRMRAEA